jgi:hypothetical protein
MQFTLEKLMGMARRNRQKKKKNVSLNYIFVWYFRCPKDVR